MKAGLWWSLGALLVVACGSATSGETDGGISGNHGRADDGGTPGAAGSDASSSGMTGSGSSGGGDDSGSAEASSSEAGGGDSAGADGSSTGHPDASSCMAPASSTASQPGYLGDWTAGDYPSNFSGGKLPSTISGVTGQMGNDRQYGVHVPMGYSASTPVPAVFCIHGLDQNPAAFLSSTPASPWPTKAGIRRASSSSCRTAT